MNDIIQTEGGMCECGCGQRTRLAPVNDRSKGWVKGQPLRFVSKHAIELARQIRNSGAIGNLTVQPNGYVTIHTAVGPRYLHIVVAEKALGRPLRQISRGHPDNEVVHHIDGDKQRNAPANLLICTHSYHTALHARLEASPLWPEFPMRVRRPDLVRAAA
jgi:hypothetical protein